MAQINPLNVRLKEGDILLYRPGTSWISKVIAWKTWMPWSHCEMCLDPGRTSIGSRDEGSDIYPMRWNDLGRVLRPPDSFDIAPPLAWFEQNVRGTAYDLWGLLRFMGASRRADDAEGTRRFFCSELCTHLLRRGGVRVFNGFAADQVPPGWFAQLCESLETVWSDGKP